MAAILQVRFASLDCAHLGALARDFYSDEVRRRECSRRFLEALRDAGWLLLVNWHQFEELIKHRNDKIATERVAFLRAQPLMAWLSAHSDEEELGSIVDLFVSEIEVSLGQPSLGAADIRDRVRPLRLRSGSGEEMLSGRADRWMEIRPLLWEREERAREIASITQADVVNRNRKARIGDYLQGLVRPRDEVRRELDRLRQALTAELAERGDEQLQSPYEAAAEFVREVAEEGLALRSDDKDPVGAYLHSRGIEPNELDPRRPFSDLLDLAMFRHRLRQAEQILRLPHDSLRRTIRGEAIPSWVTERAMIHHRARPIRIEGSDVTDKYMLSASVYADLSLVDKRTKENHRRIAQKEPDVARLFNRVERAASYEPIASLL